MQKRWQFLGTLAIFLFFLAWALYSNLPSVRPTIDFDKGFDSWALWYLILPLWGGVLGIVTSKKWGGLKSVTGQAIIMFSLGLLAEVFGQVGYAYIGRFTNLPYYPSFGDIGYFAVIPFYSYGVILLARASGIELKYLSTRQKIQTIIIPIIVLTIGYFAFLQGYVFDWNDPVKVFLDFGYPLGEALYISLAIAIYLLAKNTLGGIMRSRILFVLFALLMQFISDWSFIWVSNKSTYLPGGIIDTLYLFSYLTMTLALLALIDVFERVNLTAVSQKGETSLIKLIISVHKELIGTYAVKEANKVEGLQVSKDLNTITVTGDLTEAADRLIKRYTALFGNNSIQLCKDACLELLPKISTSQLPEVLR